MGDALLEIRNATKVYGGGFLSRGERVVALQDFNLSIHERPATITAIAGESGSGKTTIASAVLGFLQLSSGEILYQGTDIGAMSRQQRLAYRRQVQAVFQDPYESYNPFYRVKHIFDMPIRHLGLAERGQNEAALIEDALRTVGLRGGEILEKHPHQLSGGQRQRIMVARACMLRPKLIVADEPVSAVDASLRASILDVMMRLRDESNISFLYITHDLSTAYQVCDDICVLYQGIVAERGRAVDVIANPHHPYVQLLVNSVPVPDPDVRWGELAHTPNDELLRSEAAQGCRFYPRCPRRFDRCREQQPPRYLLADRQVACFHYESGHTA
jgi:peptide/nickel transport system ATP-binding protein